MAEPVSISRALAEWSAQVDWASSDAVARGRALDSIVDTIGVAMIGTREPEFAVVRQFAADSALDTGDSAELWGDGVAMGVGGAALLNATAGHVMDFDDVHDLIHGHPTTVLLPALVAAAQHFELPGERVLTGYLAGLGVMAAVSRAYGPRHYTRGWHSTATCGAVGAAAGVAVALSMNAEQIATAMNAAVSMSMGVRANFGTLMKPLHAGLAARAAVEAVLLTRAGASTAADALGAPLGGVDVFGDGSWPADYADPIGALIETAEQATVELGLKMFPCCKGAHYAVDAALEVRAMLESGDQVDRVTVRYPTGSKTALLYDDPTSGLEAKFSLPYTVATAIAHGTPAPRHFLDEAIHDAPTRSLMATLEMVEDTSAGDLSSGMEGRYAEVIATTTTGRQVSATVEHPRGSWNRPLTADEVDEKFLLCVDEVLGAAPARELLARVRGLEGVADVAALFSGLR